MRWLLEMDLRQAIVREYTCKKFWEGIENERYS